MGVRDRTGGVRRIIRVLRAKRFAIELAQFSVQVFRKKGMLRDVESDEMIHHSEVLSTVAVDSRTREVVAEFPLSEPGRPA